MVGFFFLKTVTSFLGWLFPSLNLGSFLVIFSFWESHFQIFAKPLALWFFHVLCNQAVRKLSCGFRKVPVSENSIPFKKKKKKITKKAKPSQNNLTGREIWNSVLI